MPDRDAAWLKNMAEVVRINLEVCVSQTPELPRHPVFQLIQAQAKSLVAAVPGPPPPHNLYDPTPREMAETIEINLQVIAEQLPLLWQERSWAIALDNVRSLMQALPGRDPDPYRDPGAPERACDRCNTPYRGPAVYCSRYCAYADGALA